MANTGKGKGARASVVVWSVLIVLLLAVAAIALNVTQRYRRVVQETNQVRSLVQQAVKRQQMITRAPARKEFSSAFLQMAFGDNPPLLEKIKQALEKAIGDRPQLAQGDIAMMLVTYRAEGEPRDVAVQIFGNLVPERLPRFSSEGHWRARLPSQLYDVGQSMLSLFGRELVILADADVEQRQREIFDSVLMNRFDILEHYLYDPVSFVAVIPEPANLVTDRYSPYLAAILVKGKVSLSEFRGQLIALSFDPKRAEELAQMMMDSYYLFSGIARVRFASIPGDMALKDLQKVRVRVDGPTVVVEGMMPEEVVSRVLPRFVRVLSKGIRRIEAGPGYPS
jgi:hypothetical protein